TVDRRPQDQGRRGPARGAGAYGFVVPPGDRRLRRERLEVGAQYSPPVGVAGLRPECLRPPASEEAAGDPGGARQDPQPVEGCGMSGTIMARQKWQTD